MLCLRRKSKLTGNLRIWEVKLQVFDGQLKTASGTFKLTRKVRNNKLYI